MTFLHSQDFRDNILQHFVSITGMCIEVDASGEQVGDEQRFAYSAFVIEIYGVWCLVTAGHVLQNMEAACSHPKMKMVRCSLADYFNPVAAVKKPTPFPFQESHRLHMDQDGVDVGVIPLTDFYRDSLKSNGIVPIPVSSWRGYFPPKCDEYTLLGLPEEGISQIPSSATHEGGIRARLMLIGLEPKPVPEDKIVSKIPRFCAALLDGGPLKSVKGMSGGPIIGIRANNGKGEYACIAVQGSWDKDMRMVFGTPMALIVAGLKAHLDTFVMKTMPLTKLDAARRQLETAVEMFFFAQDPVAIQTLVTAAYDILRTVAHQGVSKPVLIEPQHVPPPEKPSTHEINTYQAFFRVHDNPNATLEFDPMLTTTFLSTTCAIYMGLTGERVKSFFCVMAWVKCRDGRPASNGTEDENKMADDLFDAFSRGDRVAFYDRLVEPTS
jgi:hypothetical protein